LGKTTASGTAQNVSDGMTYHVRHQASNRRSDKGCIPTPERGNDKNRNKLSTKITNNSSANHLAKLGLGVPSGSAKPQLGLWMGCSLLDIT